ncbi:MAG: Cys-tRNA(Pro) deacylase [Treponemataceae bacterium]|nr:Cys-tRNA(Pro) deacylase [Treponemataceae bacterium]
MKKTNAMRILDGLKIPYETLSYDDDGEHELSHGAAERTAATLGIDAGEVFKTIVMRTDKKETVVFCHDARHETNLKKARAACGAKEVSPVKSDELPALTGYVRGGCSPLGMKRKFRTFIDQRALDHEKIFVSAGTRGEQLALAPADLVRATSAQVADLALEP